MSTAVNDRTLSQEVVTEMQNACLRIRPPVSANRLWSRLTERDRQQLGGNLEAAYTRLGTAGMWMEVRGVSPERAIVEVAREIGFLSDAMAQWLLRELGEFFDDPNEMLQAALAAGGLVLIDVPRTVYWHGVAIEFDWEDNPALWELMWELCVHAKRSQSIDYMTFGESLTPKGLTDRKSRLSMHLPADLRRLVRSAGLSTYRLDLPGDRIRIFTVEQRETLVEVTGASRPR